MHLVEERTLSKYQFYVFLTYDFQSYVHREYIQYLITLLAKEHYKLSKIGHFLSEVERLKFQ